MKRKPEPARVIPLGTSSGVPTATRNVSSLALSLGPGARSPWLLLDCGEGTQQRLIASGLKLGSLQAILITHLHGDHFFGLPGLLSTLGMRDRVEPLTVYGPPGLARWLKATLKAATAELGFTVRVQEIHKAGLLAREPLFKLRVAKLKHRVEAWGYRIETAGGIVAYCTDTKPCPASARLGKKADLLIHEATYTKEQSELAIKYAHSTAGQAAEVARKAGARQLLITHFSARFGDPAPLLEEARAVFPATIAAREFQPVPVGARSS